MAPAKIRRIPDAAVATSVAQVVKQQKSKRMMMFGLRNLSELCAVTSIKSMWVLFHLSFPHRENSAAALESGIVPALKACTDMYSDDEDVVLACIKILHGIGSQLLEETNRSLTEQFQEEEGPEAVASILKNVSVYSDEDILPAVLACLTSLEKLGIKLPPETVATSLVHSIKKLSPSTGLLVMQALSRIADNPANLAILSGANAADKILELLSTYSSGDELAAAAAEAGLHIVQKVAKGTKSTSAHLNGVIRVMDMFKSKRAVVDRGSAVLATMLSPEELKRCLETLATASEGSLERHEALIMLASMSYISSYADAVVRAGGIPMLCNAVKTSAESLEKGLAEAQLIKGLNGACKMLGKIAESSTNIESIVAAGGVTALCAALKATKNIPPSFAIVCDTLAPLALTEDQAKTLFISGSYSLALKTLKQDKETHEIAASTVHLMAVAVTHDQGVDELYSNGAMDCLAACLSLHQHDSSYLADCLACLTKLSSLAESFENCEAAHGALLTLMESKGIHDEDLAKLGLEFLQQLLTIPEALGSLQKGDTAEVIMDVILAHLASPVVQFTGKTLLETIATDEDVNRCLRDLEKSMSDAKGSPEKAYRSLAMVNGLSQVSRLRQTFEQKDAAKTILEGIAAWVQGPAFPEQQRVIKAAALSVDSLVINSTTPIEIVILNVINICLLPQLKNLNERQSPQDNNLLDLLKCCKSLVSKRQVKPESGASVIEAVIKLSWKYQDLRRVQVICLDILVELAAIQDGAKHLKDSGGLKNVVSYMNKVIIYEDVQCAGLRLLAACLKADPASAEAIKYVGGADLCKNIRMAHAQSEQVKMLLPPVIGALMPQDFMDADIKKALDALASAVMDGKPVPAAEAALALTGHVSSPEGCRAAIHNRVGLAVQNASSLAKSESGPSAADLAAELSKLSRSICESRVGSTHLSRCNGAEVLSSLLQAMTLEDVKETSNIREGIEANLYAYRSLMRVSRVKNDPATIQRHIAAFCMVAAAYPDDEAIGGAVTLALASISSDQLTKSPEFQKAFSIYVGNLKSQEGVRVAAGARGIAGLLDGAGDEMIELLLKEKGLQQLFDCLESNVYDKRIRQDVLSALTSVARKRNLLQTLKTEGGDEAVSRAVGILVKALRENVDDGDSAVEIVKLLNILTTGRAKEQLAGLGLADLASDIMKDNADNKELALALGVLLGNLGAGEATEATIREVIRICKAKDADWQRNLQTTLSKLSVLLLAEVDDVDKSFKQTQAMCDALAKIVASETGDVALLSSIALVGRRLGDKFESEPDSLYGAKAMEKSLAPSIVEALSSNAKANSSRSFLLNSYRLLADSGKNSSTHQTLKNNSAKFGLVPIAFDTLSRLHSDTDVSTAITEYIASVSSQPEGAALVLSSAPKASGMAALQSSILTLMREHKGHGPLAAAGVTLIGNLAISEPILRDPKLFKDVGIIAEETPQGMTSLFDTISRFIVTNDTACIESEFSKADERFQRLYESKATPSYQRANLVIAYSNMVRSLAMMGNVEHLNRLNLVDILTTALEDMHDDPRVVLAILAALKEAADADADLNAKICRQIPIILFGECAATIKGTPMLNMAALELIYSLGCNEGNGHLLAHTEGFASMMDMQEMAAGTFSPEEAARMKRMLSDIRNVVEQDTPKSLTLEELYERWQARKAGGETLEISESAVVMQQFDVLCDYMDEYSKKNLEGLDSELGKEFKFGCLCLSLLHEYPSNASACLEKGEPQMLLHSMITQSEEIAQCAILCARDLTSSPEGMATFATMKGCQQATIANINNVSYAGDRSVEVLDELMIPRLELIERCSIHRHHYTNTDCMEALISIWDKFDEGSFSEATLRSVFRAMRRIVNETWAPVILANQVPRRLIAIVGQPKQDYSILPDVLFLMGALATVPEIKTLIGELRGIEPCIDLLEKCLKATDENTSATQTNICLALANITIGHTANTGKLIAARGIERNIEVLDASMAEGIQSYDVANAASILMCNLCYRRDDVKQIFGQKGGPRSVTECIQKYDGSDSKSAFRCVSSMLKAIGNLGLYTPNVNTFLELKVEETFAHLLENSEFLPDELLEVSLRTMSNLVLENTDEFMEKFGTVLLPLLSVLDQTTRESTRMLSLVFDVIGNLCRLPANAKTFADNNGIERTLKVANAYTDSRIAASTIHVLGVQTNYPESIKQLQEAGVFSFLINLFESQAAAEERQPEVCLAGLRCLRRLLLNKRSGEIFVNAGGAQSIIRLMSSTSDLSLVQLDGYKDIIGLLNLFPPPAPVTQTAEDDEWDAPIADEGVLSLVNRLDRPPSPRSWESIKLDEDIIKKLILSICSSLLEEGHERQIKLQKGGLGLLAYFACAKLPNAVEAFYAGQYHSVVRTALQNYQSDLEVVETCCILLANVSYVSEPEELRVASRDWALQDALEAATSKIPKKQSRLKDFCVLTQKLFADRNERDPKKFESLVSWDYDFELTEWNKDPYPNGVQDLPQELKKALREGGRGKLVVEVKARLPFCWKSSQDLTQLQWRTTDDADAPYSMALPVIRIRAISRGLATPLLEQAGANDRKVDAKACLVIVGPPSDEAPNGLELNLKMKSKKERDGLIQLFSEWKDATTYGF